MSENTTAAARPAKAPIELTLAMAKKFKPHLERKLCLVIRREDGVISYRNYETGIPCSNVDEAKRISVWDAIAMNPYQIDSLRLILIDQELAARLIKKRCAIGEVLTQSIVSLLELAPGNPQARGHVLAQTGKMPPDSCKTYEEVRDWIEDNCGPDPEAEPFPESSPPAPPERGNAFTVRLDFTAVETGRCHYRDGQSGSISRPVTREDINALLAIHEPYASLSELAYGLNDLLMDDPWDLEPEMTSDDEIIHSDYDAQGEEHGQATIRGGMPSLLAILETYLRTTQTPEQLRRRGM